MPSQPRTSDRYNPLKNRNASEYTSVIKDETIYAEVAEQSINNGPFTKDDGSIYYGPVFLNPDDGCMTHVDSYSLWYSAADGRTYCLDPCGNPIYRDGVYSGAQRVSDQSNVDINDMSFASLSAPSSGSATTSAPSGPTNDPVTAAEFDTLKELVIANEAGVQENKTGVQENKTNIIQLQSFTTEYDNRLAAVNRDLNSVSEDLGQFKTSTGDKFTLVDSEISGLSQRITTNSGNITSVTQTANTNKSNITILGNRILTDEASLRDVSGHVMEVEYSLTSFEAAVGLTYVEYGFTTQAAAADGKVALSGSYKVNGSPVPMAPITLQPPFFNADRDLIATMPGYNGITIDMSKSVNIAWVDAQRNSLIAVGTPIGGGGSGSGTTAMFPPSTDVKFFRVADNVTQIATGLKTTTATADDNKAAIAALKNGSSNTVAGLEGEIHQVKNAAYNNTSSLNTLKGGSTKTIPGLQSEITANSQEISSLKAGSAKTVAGLDGEIQQVKATAGANTSSITVLKGGSTKTIAGLQGEITANTQEIAALKADGTSGRPAGDLVINAGYAIEYLGNTAPAKTANCLYPVNGVMYYNGQPINTDTALITDISASLDDLVDVVEGLSKLVDDNKTSITTLTADVNFLKSNTAPADGRITLSTRHMYVFTMQNTTSGDVSGHYTLNGVPQSSFTATTLNPPFYDTNDNVITTFPGAVRKDSSPPQSVVLDLTKPISITVIYGNTYVFTGTSTAATGSVAATLAPSSTSMFIVQSTTDQYHYATTASSASTSSATAQTTRVPVAGYSLQPAFPVSLTTPNLLLQSQNRQLVEENESLKERMTELEETVELLVSSLMTLGVLPKV